MTAGDLHGSCSTITVLLPAGRALLPEPGLGGRSGRLVHHRPARRGTVPPRTLSWTRMMVSVTTRGVTSARGRWAAGAPPRRLRREHESVHSGVEALATLSQTPPMRGRPVHYGLCRPILELPAIDQAERWRRVPAECPYCAFKMLRVQPRAGTVTCLRYGVCRDSDGHHPIGHVYVSAFTGDPRVHWNDGLVAP